jgi:septin family protein
MRKTFTKEEIAAFKEELKALLSKYNAEIYAQMDGDTHGVSCEVVIDLGNVEVIRKNDSVSQYDIK